MKLTPLEDHLPDLHFLLNTNTKSEYLLIDSICQQNTITNPVFKPKKLAELNDAGFIIGGSLALRLYGYKIGRYIDEVDLIVSTNDFDCNKIVKYFEGLNDCPSTSHIGGDSKYCFEGLNNELYDVLTYNGKVDYTTIIIDGVEIKLQDEQDIWFKKKEYAYKGYTKHEFDLKANDILTSEDELKYFIVNCPKKHDTNLDLPF